MNPIVKNILAVVAGVVIGSLVNMGIVQLGYGILPIEGVDPNDMDALIEVMPTLGAKHFVFPFLAHALGTLAGAGIAAYIAANNQMKFALGIGVFFLLGGITAVSMFPGPTWFAVVDLALAYIPMAWFGGKFGSK